MRARVALSFVAVFLFVAFGNAVTHGLVMGEYMNRNMAVLGPGLRGDAGGIPILAVAWLLIALGTVYFSVHRAPTPSYRDSAIAGALVGLLVDGSWNVINKSLVPAWSWSFIAVDVTWHVVHGVAAGLIFAALMRVRAQAAAPQPAAR